MTRDAGDAADASQGNVGIVAGIAWRPARLAPMCCVETGLITRAAGLEGDHKGPKFPRRQITVLALEDWQAALADLADPAAVVLHWTTRRANLLVSGIRLPRAVGSIIAVGPVKLEVTFPTVPCARMDAAFPGLRRALHPDWRGGVTARVRSDGRVTLGDAVRVLLALPEMSRRLP